MSAAAGAAAAWPARRAANAGGGPSQRSSPRCPSSGRRVALGLLALAPAAREAHAEEGPRSLEADPVGTASAAEAAGDWARAQEAWTAAAEQADAQRNKAAAARARFRASLAAFETGDAEGRFRAAVAIEKASRVLPGAETRVAAAAAFFGAGEGAKAEAFFDAAKSQGPLAAFADVEKLGWPPSLASSLADFRAAKAPPAPSAAAAADLSKFEQARETKAMVRDKLGAANSLEPLIFGAS